MQKLKKVKDNFKKIDEALNQERELYADLANALPSGIYRLRVFSEVSLAEERWYGSNNAPYVVEFVNDHFCEILNLDKVGFKTNPGIINSLIYEADRAEFARLNVIANLHVTQFIWEGRFNINGKLIWVHFESIPRLLENKDILWTGTLNDITERKTAEQELIVNNQELQKLNAEKDKFFSIIAHDLKSPFSSIIGFSDVLVEEVGNKDYTNIALYSNIIKKSSVRALNLLINLMEWAQTQTGRMKFNPEYLEMNMLVNEIVLFCSDMALQKSIVITNDTHSMIPLYADKAMINTILRNLVSNAIKFTQPGGRINIICEAHQNKVNISIKDTGIGMSESSIGKLFRIDTNHSTPGTINETGTGLGLILCKEFIDKHNGEIWVESEPGQGSVFCFSIPCIQA